MSSQFRYDGAVRTVLGQAVQGASIAVLSEPANLTTQPGSPLISIFAAATSNAATLTGASFSNGQITFIFSGSVPADVVAGAYVAVSGVNPILYNAVWQVLSVSGLNVVCVPPFGAVATNPGTYVSGGTVATSALPNPFQSDGLGNFFFYAAAGIYTVQIYDTLGRINELDLLDQGVVAGGGNGSVTSVALAMPAEFSVSGSPVISSGTLTVAKANENANVIFAGPSSGGAAAPAFRSLVAADIPALPYVSSVAVTFTVPAIFTETVTGSPVTSSGTIALTLGLANENANLVFAGPSSGGAGQPAFRGLVAADLPTTSQFPVASLTGTADALTFPTTSFVKTAAVDAMTLGTPVAGTDDGKFLTVVSTTAFAHTITAGANVIAPSHHLLTFTAAVGSFVELVAFGGLWYVLASSGVTAS